MTPLREAALQALEAMEYSGMDVGKFNRINAACKALRAALAEPVQEPFGYLWPTGRHPEFRFTQKTRDGVDGMPLYSAPIQRKPLTVFEIDAIAEHLDKTTIGWSTHEFAAAIEKAHEIGGEA